MIEFANVVTKSFGPLTFSVEATQWWRICLPNADVRNELTACLTGCNRPLEGRVTIMGKDIYEITEEEFVSLFRNIGVVTETGDMISNLKVWENIVLPSWYHGGEKIEHIEKRLSAMLEESHNEALNLTHLLPATPAELTPQQRRIASFFRVHLLAPDYFVYCGLTDAMNKVTAQSMQKAITRRRRPKMGALFITSDPDSLGDVVTDGDIDVKC